MQINLSIHGWECDGVINHYRLNHVDKALNKMKLYTAGMVRLVNAKENYLLMLPVVAQEIVDTYCEGFTTPILLDRRDDAHIVDLQSNYHYVAQHSEDWLEQILKDVMQKQHDYICKRLGWQQTYDYVGNCLNIPNDKLVKLPQKYFPTIFANINVLHTFTKSADFNRYNHYYISATSNRKLVLVIRQTSDSTPPALSSDDFCSIVRTYNNYHALITGLEKNHVFLSNNDKNLIKERLFR